MVDCQYYKRGKCTETERPSGRIHTCELEHDTEKECNMKEEEDALPQEEIP